MTTIAFIGLGHMGGGMAANLAKAGHDVRAFDLAADALGRAVAAGCIAAASAAEAVADADVVVTMLPAGRHVAQVYDETLLGGAKPNTLLIDCSTIDVATARDVATGAEHYHGGRDSGRGDSLDCDQCVIDGALSVFDPAHQ